MPTEAYEPGGVGRSDSPPRCRASLAPVGHGLLGAGARVGFGRARGQRVAVGLFGLARIKTSTFFPQPVS